MAISRLLGNWFLGNPGFWENEFGIRVRL